MITNDQPPKTVASAVMAALGRPDLFKGALISVVLFFSVYLLPLPGFFLYAFTPVPLVYHYFLGGRMFGLTMMGTAAAGVFLLFTLLGNGVEGLTFLVHVGMALAIGEGFLRQKDPGRIVCWAAAAFLGITLLVVTLDGLSHGMGPVTYIKTYMREHVRDYLDAYRNFEGLGPVGREEVDTDGGNDRIDRGRESTDNTTVKPTPTDPSGEMLDRELSPDTISAAKWVEIMVSIAPGSLIVGALLIAWANFIMVRLFLIKSIGLPQELVNLREWRAPEPLVWPVIAFGFIVFLPLGFPRIIAVNGLLVLWLIYFFQGLCIISFWFHRKSAPPLIRTLIYLAIFLQPFLYLVIAVAGLFDLWFDFRKLKKEDQNPA